MKTKLIFLLVGSGLITACSPTFDSEESTEDKIVLEHNQEILNSRINYINKPLVVNNSGKAEIFDPEAKEKTAQSVSQTSTIENSEVLDHNWYFVAEVESPVFKGSKLSATHVQVVDDKAYVSYNKQGDIHLGGLEVFDLTNRAYPKLVSQALFDNADVNAITTDYQGDEFYRKIWLALSHKNKGAVVRQISLRDGLISNQVKDISLSKFTEGGVSASANGVVRSGNDLYITAGKTHGGTFTLNVNDLSFKNSEEYSDAKYVATNGSIPFASSVVTLVTGDSAELKVKPVGSESLSRSIPIGTAVHQNVELNYRGKSTLHFAQRHPETVFVTMGLEGLKGFDIYTEEEVFRTPDNILTKGNINGVTSDFDYLYTANGADGISVFNMPENPGELQSVFEWDMNEVPGSANYMTTDGEWIFVAKGGEGLKILRKGKLGEHQTLYGFDSKGVPHGMEPKNVEVCSELLPNLFRNVLPERSNVTVRNPEYFDNPNREIELLKDDKVYVTFISEGAGYRNTLGYYYYHKDNPPSQISDLNKVVIFPNASAKYSGGDLIQGNTMKLLGDFEEGTVIGFFVISNGWNGNKITDGIYTQYTIPEFNVSERQQSIVFYDEGCTSIVLAFEDIALPQGDKDFNDAIFMISSEDPESISTSDFIRK
ncbi:MAG: DUF4114 domain-containing protein [Balneolaceae bacterium]|nr:DUF4114 domain-containing protein [Balneolaceae bacterium]MBO6546325.1 DUF4114 domain-containing protein [Balneolaceae bacterium]MBO6648684.1 DUF4114 domain-containing protein [Balneolaceae bacterium]